MKIFNKALDVLGALLFLAMLVVIIIQIVARFVLKISIPWTEEMSRLLFLYVVFIGAAIASRSDSHLLIDSVTSKIPAKYVMLYRCLIMVCTITVMVIFLVGCLNMIPVAIAKQFQTIKLNAVWTYIAPISGFTLMIFYSIINFVKMLKNGNRMEEGK